MNIRRFLGFADLFNNRTNLNADLVRLKTNKVLLALTVRYSKIFISYRRNDSAGHAGWLHADIIKQFGVNQVFFDIDVIPPGEDFTDAIQQAVSSCSVMVAVIGRDWLGVADGRVSKLDDPQDFVRLEISTALNRKIPIIPVLINGAKMPRAEDVPKTLEAITRLQAHEISDSRWDYDVRQLNKRLAQVIPKRTVSRQTIIIIAGFITLLALVVMGSIYMRSPIAQINPSGAPSSPAQKVFAERSNKSAVWLGIGQGDYPHNYALFYRLSDDVCGTLVDRIKTKVNVKDDSGAQEILKNGLNEAQRNFLMGQITSKAKRLLADVKAEILKLGNGEKELRTLDKDDDLDTLSKDDELDTLIGNIVDMR